MKRILSGILACAMVLTLTAALAPAALAAVSTSYVNEAGEPQMPIMAEPITGGGATTIGTDDIETWYIVNNNISYADTLTIIGNVNIILMDGKSLAVEKTALGTSHAEAISVASGASLTIWSQSLGDDMGELFAKSTQTTSSLYINSGIYLNGGSLTMNGGKITAEAIQNNAGYSEGIYGSGSSSIVTVNAGLVTVTGKRINGNGGAYGIECGTTIIHGGTVYVNADAPTSTDSYSFGISGKTTITGGTVHVNVKSGAHGTGLSGMLTISGGTVDIDLVTGGRAVGMNQSSTISDDAKVTISARATGSYAYGINANADVRGSAQLKVYAEGAGSGMTAGIYGTSPYIIGDTVVDVMAKHNGTGDVYGIYGSNDITVGNSSTDTATVTATATGNANAYGIYANHASTSSKINYGTVAATGTGTQGTGIYVAGGGLVISGGRVSAVGHSTDGGISAAPAQRPSPAAR